MERNSLVEIGKKYQTDKNSRFFSTLIKRETGHDYLKTYDNILKDKQVKSMLEIGVFYGMSIKLWAEYFGNTTTIHGIDIRETHFKKSELETENIKIHIGNQSDTKFLKSITDNYNFDFIIDDGSHRMKDQQISFAYLFPLLNCNGIYVIEDLQTSKNVMYHDNYPETTTIEFIKALKYNLPFYSHYIKVELIDKIREMIADVQFYNNDKICFIYKS